MLNAYTKKHMQGSNGDTFTKKEKKEVFRFWGKRFEAPIKFCVETKYFDQCEDTDLFLSGKIEACPSKRNEFRYRVVWKWKGVKNLPNGFEVSWLRNYYPNSEEDFFKARIIDYEESSRAATVEQGKKARIEHNGTDAGYVDTTKIRVEKIRIYPNDLQREVFEQWLECIKESYNRLVEKWPLCEKAPGIQEAREFLKTLQIGNNVPVDIQECAIFDMLNAAKAQKSKKRHNRHYNATFKQKESINQCGFEIRDKHWKSRGKKNKPLRNGYGFFGPNEESFGDNVLRSKYHLPIDLDHACRIRKDLNGKWFLYLRKNTFIQKQVAATTSRNSKIDSVVGLDPGIRTFMTTYSSCGIVTEWAVNDSRRLHRLHCKADKLQSLIDTNKGSGKSILLFLLLCFRVANI